MRTNWPLLGIRVTDFWAAMEGLLKAKKRESYLLALISLWALEG
jgi:hypothetical protein